MSIDNPTMSSPKNQDRRIHWLHDQVFCIPNTKLDTATKMVVFGISQEFVRRGISHTQPTKIWTPNVMGSSGVSKDTVQSSTSKLVKAEALTKELKWEKDKLGEKKQRVYIAFTLAFMRNPAALFVEVEESGHGGKRIKRHKGCGGEIVNLCTTCGQTHIPNHETYLEEVKEDDTPDGTQGAVDKDGQPLPSMEELDHWYDMGTDAAEIPDDVAEPMGGEDAALQAKPLDIRTRMNMPRYQREVLYDEDMSEVDAALSEIAKEPKYEPMDAGTPIIQKGKYGRTS